MAFYQALPHSFKEALKISKRILQANHELLSLGLVDTEAEQIVIASYRKATHTRLTRMELYLKLEDAFPEDAGKHVLVFSGARASGKLLQHLLGYQVFLNHEIEVSPGVLVPRPETESLVLTAIRVLDSLSNPPKLGIEIGIGSGILSIELLHRFPNLQMVASEVSPVAKKMALKNAQNILNNKAGESRLKILDVIDKGLVCEPFCGIQGAADFLITNPPYLIQDENEVSLEVLNQEPHEALFAPLGDPLFFYRQIAEQAKDYLKPRGFVFAEIPHERASDIVALFRSAEWKVEIILDLTQRERIIVAQLE